VPDSVHLPVQGSDQMRMTMSQRGDRDAATGACGPLP
jgi:hypothetical protein